MKGIRAVEIGDRVAVGACGSLLAAMGAETILVEPVTTKKCHKWSNRPVVAAGKRSLRADLDDSLVRSLLARADVVIASSDLAQLPRYLRPSGQIVCDITAYGADGPLSGRPHGDALLQAVTGLIDTTGEADALPGPINFPIVEALGALYAVAGVQAALRVRARDGTGQNVEVALYDCAFSTLTTFLPFHIVGQPVSRCGNGHVLAVPWNAYQARDGWLIICTTTDEQWTRLCAAMDAPGLALEPRFRNLRDRIEHRASVDAAVQVWVGGGTVGERLEKLQSRDIASGPIVTIENLLDEPNLRHRGALILEQDPVSGKRMMVPSGIIKMAHYRLTGTTRIPVPDEDREYLARQFDHLPPQEPSLLRTVQAPARPLAGFKVLEIGQFTTVPLAARQLAALGAEVLKIEPPAGDGARAYVPQQDGRSYFFVLSNSDKRSLRLDLRTEADRNIFRSLVAESDVVMENLKPGSLERLGLGASTLTAINPRLVYCAVSGFGADSIYPGRAAFDTVVQAMSGIMDLNSVSGVPQKTGISIADIVGGLFGLIGTLDALATRDLTGRGERIDVSMQDAAAWMTCLRAADSDAAPRTAVFGCDDGYVVASRSRKDGSESIIRDLLSRRSHTRSALVDALTEHGIAAAPVLSVGEAAGSEQARARALLLDRNDDIGRVWPLLNCPIRLAATPASVHHPIGPLGEANDQIKAHLAPAIAQSHD